MKKLLILGGSRYIVPVINTAHDLGIYIITADNQPNNPAHKYSEEYVNISVTEKEKVLEAAVERNIDGIISFACDPGVVSAAYVAEMMNLPFQCSYKTACILQDKSRFRKFLKDNGFNCPWFRSYQKKEDALADINMFPWPVMVKPTDSAGSKGVSKVDDAETIATAIDNALECSRSGSYIIEEFLNFEGFHSSTDPFTIDGELNFISFSDQLFDSGAANPYTPAYIIWPSSMKETHQQELTIEIQRLMTLLGMRTGIYNIESCVANGKPFIMEVSPRGGGCKIAELQHLAYGVNLIEAEIKMAVGLPVDSIKQRKCDGHWCEMVIHARPEQYGKIKSLKVDSDIANKYLQISDLVYSEGDYIKPFTGANMSIGDMIFKFSSRVELNEVMRNERQWLHIEVE